MSGTIVVCPLSRLAETFAASGAGRVVTLLAPRADLPSLPGADHLWLGLSDIAAPRHGHVLAEEGHVADLLAFARGWDRRRPLLVHCYAGVSRSTAAAYAIACALDPGRDEGAVARALRKASPSATPNPRLVALADAALGRRGRMVEAVQVLGRGRDCFEGEVFTLDVPAMARIEAHADRPRRSRGSRVHPAKARQADIEARLRSEPVDGVESSSWRVPATA